MADAPDDEQQDDGGRLDRRSILKYGGSGAVAAGLAGCQSPQNPYPGSGLRSGNDGGNQDDTGQDDVGDGDGLLSGETVRIGILAPMNLPLGESMWDAARLAAEQLNNSGGMLGAKVEVELGNTNVSPATARSEHRRLVTQAGCDITMGIFLGSALIQTLPSISNQQTIHITTASADPRAGKLVSKSNDDITGEGGETEYERFKYHFRAGPLHLLDLADAMLEFIENNKDKYGWEQVALMTENVGEFDPYHDRLSNRLSDVIDVPVKKRVGGISDWSPIFNEIESEGCDLSLVGLALIGTSAVNQWSNQERDFEFGGIHVPSQSFSYWESTNGNTEFVFSMNAMTPQTSNTEQTQDFVQAYQEKWDTVPIYSGALTYDAITLTEQALRATMEGEGIEGEIPDDDLIIPYMEEKTFTGSTILNEFQFTPKDATYAHEPQWTSVEETGVPVFQQWQKDPEIREDYGTMHSFYPEQNRTADYAVPDWIGGGG
ncbi:substrate-binding domain-containing protein [Natronomonas marina]|jgi:branched-chain amino acid transport system substrate-binding protein|uniref:substrate-binding domain-containing protein n=1 Tax=Natronomonas marina TaxID=2961939 RepID=UPI0020C95F20|nr:ABC transporter substrate-binding protein [Natronomonas marina]